MLIALLVPQIQISICWQCARNEIKYLHTYIITWTALASVSTWQCGTIVMYHQSWHLVPSYPHLILYVIVHSPSRELSCTIQRRRNRTWDQRQQPANQFHILGILLFKWQHSLTIINFCENVRNFPINTETTDLIHCVLYSTTCTIPRLYIYIFIYLYIYISIYLYIYILIGGGVGQRWMLNTDNACLPIDYWTCTIQYCVVETFKARLATSFNWEVSTH